jgi:hypothetical protein
MALVSAPTTGPAAAGVLLPPRLVARGLARETPKTRGDVVVVVVVARWWPASAVQPAAGLG